MYSWAVLNQTVSETLASGGVGTPVFVRWTAAAASDGGELKPLLAAMCGYAESWLSARARRLYASGEEGDGQISLALEYGNGSSALLAVTLANGRPFMNLALLGARGAIYHSDATVLAGANGSADGRDDEILAAGVLPPAETLAAIDQSLATKQPVTLPPEGDQP